MGGEAASPYLNENGGRRQGPATAPFVRNSMEYIKGFDVSSLPEVERCGGKFYEADVQRDALEILRDHGGNYLRLRLWNEPYSPEGKPYGAGTCDLACLLGLATRAKHLGMNWMLNLHYSDFWADPGKQYPPKAWQGKDENQLAEAVYNYTTDVLCACRANGTLPGMVQVGNELTGGLLWPVGKVPNWDALAHLVGTGVQAVRNFDPGIKVMVHLDNGGNHDLYVNWFDNYFACGGDCDVIGMSYYPFWHGTMEELEANMNDIAPRYSKDLVLAETSMGFTMESYARREKLKKAERKGPATTPALVKKVPFPMTAEGQCQFTERLLKIIENVPGGHGRGFFWWEPAWLPVPGSGWAAQPGWEYAKEKGPAGNEWANQALFDYSGHALPALDVIRDYKPQD